MFGLYLPLLLEVGILANNALRSCPSTPIGNN